VRSPACHVCRSRDSAKSPVQTHGASPEQRFDSITAAPHASRQRGKHISVKSSRQLSSTQAFIVRFGTLKASYCWTGDYEQVNQAKKTFENYSVIKSGNETVGNTWEKNISFFYSTYKSYWNVAPKNKQGVTQNSPNSFAVQSAKRTMLANFKKLTKDTDDEIQKTKWETKILKAEADMVKKASSSLNETINLLSKDDSIFWRKCILINAEGNF